MISYGGLFRDPTTGVYRPGFWLASHAHKGSGRAPLCSIQTSGVVRDAATGLVPYDVDVSTAAGASSCGLCANGTQVDGTVCGSVLLDGGSPRTPSMADFLLESTRSGFIDHRVRLDGSGTPPLTARSRARILPVNFDVKTLADAMAQTGNGELGSHFDGGASFNGIIWIGSYWPGQTDGLGGGVPQPWPAQGENWNSDGGSVAADARQVPPGAGGWAPDGDRRSQEALPFPLCSASTGAGGQAGQPFTATREGTGATEMPLYAVPECSDTDPSHRARPNALRVYHASLIPKAIFPRGLTIGTNLPVYLLGDTNTTSGTDANEWVPFQVAGDAVTLLSNAWNDGNLHAKGRVDWASTSAIDGAGQRDAVPTSYWVTLFGGEVRSTPAAFSGGLINFPRFLEYWTGQPCVIRGSLVEGFSSVFQGERWKLYGYYRPPLRDWAFDPQLEHVANQPPGTPTFDVSAIRSWKRE